MNDHPRVDPGRQADSVLDRTAIIVINYDSAQLLRSNLKRISQAAPEATVIIVDSFSTDAARNEVTQLAQTQGWHLVLPDGNPGFGGGMNLGVAEAHRLGAAVVVLLNPDALISREDLRRLAHRADTCRSTLVAPILRNSQGKVVSDGAILYLADGSMRSCRSPRPVPPEQTRPWLSGACLALSVELFTAVNGFDARYFLYWEDVDMSARVVASGGGLEVLRSANAVHDEGGTQADEKIVEGGKSDSYYYYNIRNRLLYAGLHLDGRERWRWILTTPIAAREIVLRGGRRQLLRSRRPIYTAIAATWDGLKLLRQALKGSLPDQSVPIIR